VEKIKIKDFEELAVNFKSSLSTHEISKELHHSLISDLLFSVCVFIDQKSNTSFHETIGSYFEERSGAILSDKHQDYLLADIEILFSKGRKIETNFLKSALTNKDYAVLKLEVTFGVRGIDELDENIDINSRFKKLLRKKECISAVKFQPLKDLDSDLWLTVPLQGSEYGDFTQTIDGVYELMCSVAKQWV
jgi:hypothetical protein